MRFLVLPILAFAACNGGPADSGQCSDSDKITLYADADRDGYGEVGTDKRVCPPVDDEGNPSGEIPRGFATNDDDCDDFRADVNPAAVEICDGIDNDCDTDSDEGLRQIAFYKDDDGDGFGNPEPDFSVVSCAPPPTYVDNALDCDDQNAAINPDVVEVCDNDIDNNCNGFKDDLDPSLDPKSAPTWYLDEDGDTYGGETSVVQCLQPNTNWVDNADDCNDADIEISPAAAEICNRVDDDCDQLIDDSDNSLDTSGQSLWYGDADADGYGDPDVTVMACFQPWFFIDNADDCNDDEPLLGLPAPWVLDNDLDTYGAGTPSADSCTAPSTPGNWVLLARGLDCDDTNLFISPAGNEVCDGVDDDCDTLVDDDDDSLDPDFAFVFYQDLDDDGYGEIHHSVIACVAPVGYVDPVDTNGDGTVDDDDDQDCVDSNDAINPDATEICDGIDNDCDVYVDDSDPSVDLGTAGTWYADFDHDGFGDVSLSVDLCAQPDDYVANSLDCDDTDPELLVSGPWLYDLDSDGVGAGAPSATSCSAPDIGWVPSYFGTDCDNADPTRFPGNFEICNNGNDEDCDNIDPPC